MIGKQIASLYATISADTKSLDEGLKSAKAGLEGAKVHVDNLVKVMGTVAAAAMVMGPALKKAFEVGEQGAAVRQTSDSFDLLLEKVGAAPDLLEQLRIASLGTVDDLTLMSATSTLLAGTQGDLATSLANATPELLEIAKAAQKLNPSLGDTTFLYESLATGIKRASPLILDNLGLTIKVGEANEKYAASLGKTVEELTAEEQKMALLNAVLESGQVMIDQVDGSTASATDSFASLRANTDNLTNSMKAYLSVGMAPAVGGLSAWVGALGSATSAENALVAAAKQGIVTMSEANLQVNKMTWTSYSAGDAMAWLGEQVDAYNRQQQGLNDEVERWKNIQDNTNQSIEETTYHVYDATAAMQAAIPAGIGWSETITEMGTAAAEAQPSMAELFGTINTSIASPIKQFIDDIKFMQAGGAEIAAAFNAIKENFLAGAITPDEAALYAQELYIETQKALVNAGLDSKDEAAAAIHEAFGIPLEEAMSILDGIASTVDIMASMEHTIRLNFDYDLPDLGSLGGGGGGWTPPINTYAEGTDEIVSSPKLFMAGEAGPERVTVTPMDGSQGSSVTVNVSVGSISSEMDIQRLGYQLAQAVRG